MKISYAICVCNESREIYSLIAFLKKVKDPEDEINILVDTAHVTKQVLSVLDVFKDDIVRIERPFDGNFASHRNWQFDHCTGDYIFTIDPDEMPTEQLIKIIKDIIELSGADCISVPRLNLHPGMTDEWLKKSNFTANELGWINWPDYQSRVCAKNLRFTGELHESIQGNKQFLLQPDPKMALIHVKSIEKQNCRWNNDGTYKCPNGDDFYDSLM